VASSTGGASLASPRVRVLGSLVVDGVDDRELGSRKGRTVLKLLALARGAPVPVDVLAEALWTDDVPANPAEQVGVLVSRLRRVLGTERVARTDAGYALRDTWIDLQELDDRVAGARTALAAGQLGSARASGEAALALVRGPVLPEEEAGAVLAARAEVDGLVTTAHRVVAQATEASGDHLGAAAAAEAALRHDPYDEEALRILMRAHAGAGRVASALAAYVRVREQLVEDLGIGPDTETEALHDQLVRGDAARVPPVRPGGAAPVVGREVELAALTGTFARVEGGPGAAVVLVVGDAGIGKSAVVSAWWQALGPRAVVLRCRCDELDRDLPLQPVADALSDALRGLGTEEAARCLGDDRAVVAEVLGLPGAGSNHGVFGTAEAGQARLFAALLSVVERIGAGQPVVLVVDDIDRAGPATLAWLRFAHRRGRGLLVVATSRPGGPELPGAERIVVGPLDDRAAGALVGGLAPDRVEEIVARAGGNPLFLQSLAEALPGELPASIRDAVRQQLSSLGPAADAVVAAAVLGGDVDLDLVAGVLDRPATAVLDDLERAVVSGLLQERGSGLSFSHDLVRAALAESAQPDRRRLLHRAAAVALADRRPTDPLAVAVHAGLGGASELAIDAYIEAAAAALARFDLGSAAGHLDAAVELGGSAAAYAARARVRMVAVDLEPAAADAAEAIARGGGAAAYEIGSWVAYYRRRYDEARALADAGVRRAGDDPGLLASCRAIGGRVRHGAGELEAAAALLEPVDGAPPDVQDVADVWRATLLVHQGRIDAALATVAQPLVEADHLTHPWAGLHGRFAAAMALGHGGRPGAALARCGELDAAVLRTGAVGARFAAPAANIRGWLLRHTGSPEAADERNLAAVDLTSDGQGQPRSEAVMEYHYVGLLDLADGRLLAGDVGAAADLDRRLSPVDTWQGTMAWHQRHRLGLLRARLALLDGDRDRAADLAGAVVSDAGARGAARYEVLARAWLALAGGDGDLDRVAEVVDRLAVVASMEGWRLVAELGGTLGVDEWHAEASRRAAALVGAAGAHADALRAAVAAELG
jgi:DNA-binding SARP family transcriptional activator